MFNNRFFRSIKNYFNSRIINRSFNVFFNRINRKNQPKNSRQNNGFGVSETHKQFETTQDDDQLIFML